MNGSCCFAAEEGKTYTLVCSWSAMGISVSVVHAVAPAGLLISETSRTLSVGDEYYLGARFDPLWSIPEECSWSSSDPSVATVDQSGCVTVLSGGSATITVTSSSGFTAACLIQTETPTAFRFNCPERTVYLNVETQNLALIGSFEPEGSHEPIVKAESSDPSVLDVEIEDHFDGWLRWHAYKAGTTVITATTASGLTDSCTVTVKEAGEILCDVPVTVTVSPNDSAYFLFTPDETGNYAIYSEDRNCSVGMGYSYDLQRFTQKLEAGQTYEAKILNFQKDTRTWTVTIKKAVPVETVRLDLSSPFQENIDHYEGTPGQTITLQAATGPLWAQYED